VTTATSIDLSLARLLAECALARRSGIVTAECGKLRRLFCLEDGALAHAASNVIEEQFSEFLVREDLLSVGSLAEAQLAAQRAERALSRTLLEEKILDEDELSTALEQHLRELLFATLDWTDGESSLTRGKPDLTVQVTTHLSCVPLLLDYAREHPESLADVRTRIGSGSVRLVVNEEHVALAEHLDSLSSLRQLLDGCDGDNPVDVLVAGTPGEEEDKWRSLYALRLLGIVEPSTTGRQLAEDQATRDEVTAQLLRIENASHYDVLGVPTTASSDRIREAYYTLARRFHPDRFRTGPLEDLRVSIEGYFAAVTEAYNTLYNSRLRAAYDQQQAEATEVKPEQDEAFLARENFRRGKALIQKGRFRDALTSLENAVQLDGRNATYRLELGQLCARNPRLRAKAEAHLIEVNRIDPSVAGGYLALGDLYLKSSRKEDAVRLFREVLRWEPGHVEATERLSSLGVKP